MGTGGMKVLVACEFSGVVRRAFRARGHDAWSCDLLPADDGSEFHIQGDAIAAAYDRRWGWDLLIAHPPCTYLSNSGVCHLKNNPDRWAMMGAGASFFLSLLNAPVPQIAVENPIMHGHAKRLFGIPKQTQVIQPWMFGHAEQKGTCLWLKGLPCLRETSNVRSAMLELPDNQRQRLHYLPPSADRWKLRSATYAGIADAMAAQWGAQTKSIAAWMPQLIPHTLDDVADGPGLGVSAFSRRALAFGRANLRCLAAFGALIADAITQEGE